jgi:hypothetical protein
MLPQLQTILAARRPRDAAPRDLAHAVANLLVGTHVRVVAAATLMAACALWVEQNLFTPSGAATESLRIAGLPAAATAWCDGVNAGWAGVLLLASLFFRGNRSGGLALVGAAICAFGHHAGIRTVAPLRDDHVALLLGSVVMLAGFRVARR